MPAIEPAYRKNFETLMTAFQNQDVCLADCRDRETGQPRRVVCARQQEQDGQVSLVPLALLFDSNPYEILDPPGYDSTDNPPSKSALTSSPA